MSKRKWLAGISAAVLLVTTLAVGLVFHASAAVTGGTMTELTTAAQVSALGDSLIAGKTAILPNGATGTTMEKITDGLCDTIDGNSNRANIKAPNFDTTGKAATTFRLWFDLGSAQRLNRLLVASFSLNPYQIFTGSFYVADDADGLFTAEHRVLHYDYGTEGKGNQWISVATNGRAVRPVMLFDLSACYTGRYIGFEVVKPDFSKMDWQPWDAGLLLSELGVYYTNVTSTAVTALPEDTSLIAGKTAEYAKTQRINGDVSVLTDGKLDNQVDCGADSDQNDGYTRLVYTLDASASIDRVLIASANAGANYYLYRGEVYISEEKSTLWDEENRAFSYDYSQGKAARSYLYTLSDTRRGKYVGFKTYIKSEISGVNWYDVARFSELGVYAAPEKNLLAGLPVILGDGQTNRGGKPENLTDGDPDTAYASDSGKINDGWTRLSFDMGKEMEIETVELTSCNEGASFYLYKAEVYVGNNKATLWNAANRVGSFNYTQGEAPRVLTLTPETAARGKYIGFKAWVNGDGWVYCARFGELAAYGQEATAEPEVSLIAGKIAEKGAGQTDRDGTQLSALTDGDPESAYSGDCGDAKDGFSRLTYTLEQKAAIDRIAITSRGGDASFYLYKGEVYVSDDAASLWKAENRVVDYDYGQGKAQRSYTYTLDKVAAGRYIGFKFWVNGDGWYSCARIAELAVYGQPAYDATNAMVVPVTKEPQKTSLIAGNANPTVASYEFTRGGDYALATDGCLPGISEEDTGKLGLCTGDYANTWTELTYELDAIYDIDEVLIANSVESNDLYRLRWGRLYISETKIDLYSKKHLVAEYSDINLQAMLLKLNTPARGCYVGFSFYILPFDGNYNGVQYEQWWNTARIGELGVYGNRAKDKPENLTNLIAGTKPVDMYLTEPGKPDRYHEGSQNGYLNPLTSTTILRLTDGDYDTRGSWTHQRTDGLLPTLESRKYISTDTPWAVLIYHLGGTAEVNQIFLTSTGEWGNYYVAGVDYYVSMNLDTLFDTANRVYTTGGEKTTVENGETVLDPAYDVKERYIATALDTPRQGRYVALVVTRPDALDIAGWSEARVNEFEVYGTLQSQDEAVNTTFTESTYGCTLTLSQLNFDDVSFFQNLSRLEVTRTALPGGVNRQLDKWLKADPAEAYVYTFTLYDKNGNAIDGDDVGKRTITVTIPNRSGHPQTMAQVNGSTLTRVLNARTAGGQLTGENITGSWQFTPVVFENADVIYNGVGAR